MEEVFGASLAKRASADGSLWGLESSKLQLLAEEAGTAKELPFRRSNRKAARLAKKGIPDPSRCRVVSEEKGTHFTRYMDEFLSLTCASQLFPNSKELTESMAVLHAVRSTPALARRFSTGDPSVTCLVIGDGVVPRTAALAAFRTSWTCIAVDPLMEVDGSETSWGGINRLTAIRARVQDIPIIDCSKCLLVLVHAHVGLKDSLSRVLWRDALGVVAIPCCNWYKEILMPDGESPVLEQDDPHIVSPHRLVRVWVRDQMSYGAALSAR
eukprot:TRINITY_DN25661_c0_g1_i1.p1 TRINITY_DN25661_c0_g1~~TRINITY_DN25661_c0_g1_i1.p1  ORF type:complete len:269 (+),score=36.52 TRINITY_DN25661_c0_g1_i1:350-1156(+)